MDQVVMLNPQEIAVVTIGEAGPPGPAGAAGGGTAAIGTFVAGANLLRGAPVTISRTTGQAIPADAAFYTRSFVEGYAFADTLSGFSVDIYRGPVTRSDWSALAGTVSLVVGVPYFLALGGGISLTNPTTPGQTSLLVGLALTAQTLLLDPKQPFLL